MGLALVVDTIEIHNLLAQYRKGDVSAFYLFNEIKNILLDMHDVRALEGALLQLLGALSDEEKVQILPFLVTTPSARVNRFVLYELQPFVNDKTLDAIVLRLMDKMLLVPKDTVEALTPYSIERFIQVDAILLLIDAKAWEKLESLSEVVGKLDSDDRDLVRDKMESIDPQSLSHTFHGVTIEKFNLNHFIEALSS